MENLVNRPASQRYIAHTMVIGLGTLLATQVFKMRAVSAASTLASTTFGAERIATGLVAHRLWAKSAQQQASPDPTTKTVGLSILFVMGVTGIAKLTGQRVLTPAALASAVAFVVGSRRSHAFIDRMAEEPQPGQHPPQSPRKPSPNGTDRPSHQSPPPQNPGVGEQGPPVGRDSELPTHSQEDGERLDRLSSSSEDGNEYLGLSSDDQDPSPSSSSSSDDDILNEVVSEYGGTPRVPKDGNPSSKGLPDVSEDWGNGTIDSQVVFWKQGRDPMASYCDSDSQSESGIPLKDAPSSSPEDVSDTDEFGQNFERGDSQELSEEGDSEVERGDSGDESVTASEDEHTRFDTLPTQDSAQGASEVDSPDTEDAVDSPQNPDSSNVEISSAGAQGPLAAGDQSNTGEPVAVSNGNPRGSQDVPDSTPPLTPVDMVKAVTAGPDPDSQSESGIPLKDAPSSSPEDVSDTDEFGQNFERGDSQELSEEGDSEVERGDSGDESHEAQVGSDTSQSQGRAQGARDGDPVAKTTRQTQSEVDQPFGSENGTDSLNSTPVGSSGIAEEFNDLGQKDVDGRQTSPNTMQALEHVQDASVEDAVDSPQNPDSSDVKTGSAGAQEPLAAGDQSNTRESVAVSNGNPRGSQAVPDSTPPLTPVEMVKAVTAEPDSSASPPTSVEHSPEPLNFARLQAGIVPKGSTEPTEDSLTVENRQEKRRVESQIDDQVQANTYAMFLKTTRGQNEPLRKPAALPDQTEIVVSPPVKADATDKEGSEGETSIVSPTSPSSLDSISATSSDEENLEISLTEEQQAELIADARMEQAVHETALASLVECLEELSSLCKDVQELGEPCESELALVEQSKKLRSSTDTMQVVAAAKKLSNVSQALTDRLGQITVELQAYDTALARVTKQRTEVQEWLRVHSEWVYPEPLTKLQALVAQELPNSVEKLQELENALTVAHEAAEQRLVKNELTAIGLRVEELNEWLRNSSAWGHLSNYSDLRRKIDAAPEKGSLQELRAYSDQLEVTHSQLLQEQGAALRVMIEEAATLEDFDSYGALGRAIKEVERLLDKPEGAMGSIESASAKLNEEIEKAKGVGQRIENLKAGLQVSLGEATKWLAEHLGGDPNGYLTEALKSAETVLNSNKLIESTLDGAKGSLERNLKECREALQRVQQEKRETMRSQIRIATMQANSSPAKNGLSNDKRRTLEIATQRGDGDGSLEELQQSLLGLSQIQEELKQVEKTEEARKHLRTLVERLELNENTEAVQKAVETAQQLIDDPEASEGALKQAQATLNDAAGT